MDFPSDDFDYFLDLNIAIYLAVKGTVQASQVFI